MPSLADRRNAELSRRISLGGTPGDGSWWSKWLIEAAWVRCRPAVAGPGSSCSPTPNWKDTRGPLGLGLRPAAKEVRPLAAVEFGTAAAAAGEPERRHEATIAAKSKGSVTIAAASLMHTSASVGVRRPEGGPCGGSSVRPLGAEPSPGPVVATVPGAGE
eukprot:COSAG01_NODE_8119_length_2867_cov_8.576199_4_plen_160_part_00